MTQQQIDLYQDEDVQILESAEAHAFEFTPFGIVPLQKGLHVGRGAVASTPGLGDKASPAVVSKAAPQIQRGTGAPPKAQAAGRFVLDSGRPLTGKQLMQAAKSRIQEIGRILKNVPALQSERAQLQALVLAASSQTRKRRKATDGIQ